jgi:hypothetical protein
MLLTCRSASPLPTRSPRSPVPLSLFQHDEWRVFITRCEARRVGSVSFPTHCLPSDPALIPRLSDLGQWVRWSKASPSCLDSLSTASVDRLVWHEVEKRNLNSLRFLSGFRSGSELLKIVALLFMISASDAVRFSRGFGSQKRCTFQKTMSSSHSG